MLEGHADLLFEDLQAPELYTFIPQDPPELIGLRKRYAFLEGGESPDGQERWLNWVAIEHETGDAIGQFQATVRPGSSTNIGYSIFPRSWRKGYAKEMCLSLIGYIFNSFDTHVIYAEIDTRNIGSIALVESLGFSKVGMTKDADFFKGSSSDEYRFDLTRAKWSGSSL